MSIDASAFLELARPGLQSGDVSQLARTVGYRWTAKQIITLLKHPHADVRRLAAISVGMIGCCGDALALSKVLHDDDIEVVKMAEHGLWMLWFRGGQSAACEPFERGLSLLSRQCWVEAIKQFELAAAVDNGFAEAYHQCALAHDQLEQWTEAIEDCRRAIQRMPCHFGAMACMGHCFAQINDLRRALLCYREAVRIHPRLLGIREIIRRLEACLGDINDNSGRYDALPTINM